MKKIVKITDQDGNDKEYGRYPNRIGTICDIEFLELGKPMLLKYISRPGKLRTSRVIGICTDAFIIKNVTTLNSIYFFEDI